MKLIPVQYIEVREKYIEKTSDPKFFFIITQSNNSIRFF